MGKNPKEDRTILISIFAFISLTAITRFEKAIKDLFGIGQSQHLGDTRANFKNVMAGVRNTVDMGRKVATPAINSYKAGKEMKKIQTKINDLDKEGKIEQVKNRSGKRPRYGKYYGVVPPGAMISTPTTVDEKSSGSVKADSPAEVAAGAKAAAAELADGLRPAMQKGSSEYYSSQAETQRMYAKNKLQEAENETDLDKKAKLRSQADRFNENARRYEEYANAVANGNVGASGTTGPSGSVTRRPVAASNAAINAANASADARDEDKGEENGQKVLYQDAEGNYMTASEKKNKERQALVDRYNQLRKTRNMADISTVLNAGATVAGVGFAAGAWDEFHEITSAGNMISQPFTIASNAILSDDEDRRIDKVKDLIEKKYTSKNLDASVNVNVNENNNVNRNTSVNDYVTETVQYSRAKSRANSGSSTRYSSTSAVQNVTHDVQLNVQERVNQNVIGDNNFKQYSGNPKQFNDTASKHDVTHTSNLNVNEKVSQNVIGDKKFSQYSGNSKQFNDTTSRHDVTHTSNVNVTEKVNQNVIGDRKYSQYSGNPKQFNDTVSKHDVTHTSNVTINEKINENKVADRNYKQSTGPITKFENTKSTQNVTHETTVNINEKVNENRVADRNYKQSTGPITRAENTSSVQDVTHETTVNVREVVSQLNKNGTLDSIAKYGGNNSGWKKSRKTVTVDINDVNNI
ncbi:MAG: hypothetical protein IJ809_03620 [Clostridia bacterium]|nr:hypothetical protein [Clostridia bacterium]